MREIKFRAWDLENKKMLSWKKIIFNSSNNLFGSLYEIFRRRNRFIPLQYTGVKDKNGKEIYEGDICLGKFVVDEVEDYIFLQLSKDERERGEKLFVVADIFDLYINPFPEDLRIIGNIYENPELLKKT